MDKLAGVSELGTTPMLPCCFAPGKLFSKKSTELRKCAAPLPAPKAMPKAMPTAVPKAVPAPVQANEKSKAIHKLKSVPWM